MSRKSVLVDIPKKLIEPLNKLVRETGVARDLIECYMHNLRRNIDILKKAGVIGSNIDSIRDKKWGEVAYGNFTRDVIKRAVLPPHYRARINVIKALIIAGYGAEWESVYLEYYTVNGELKCTLDQLHYSHDKNLDLLYDNISKTYHVDFDKSSFNILIFPFYNPDDNRKITPIGYELKRRFIEQIDANGYLIRVEYVPFMEFDLTDPQTALEVGLRIPNTNMVIWGVDSKPKGLSHQIYFHYVVVVAKFQDNPIILEGTTKKFEISRLSEMTEGEIHLEIDEVVYYVLALICQKENDYEKTLYYLKKMQSFYPRDVILFSMAECCRNLQRFDESKEYYQQAIELNPTHGIIYNNYAMLLSSMDDDKEAVKYLKKAIEVDPNNIIAVQNLASILHDNYDFVGAKKYLTIGLSMNPDDPELNLSYASLLLQYFNDTQNSGPHFEKALASDPSNIKYINNYITYLIHGIKNYELAIEYCEKSLKLDPEIFDTHVLTAGAFSDVGDFTMAEFHFEKALAINPNHASLNLIYYLFIRDKLNDPKRAMRYKKIALKLDKGLPQDI